VDWRSQARRQPTESTASVSAPSRAVISRSNTSTNSAGHLLGEYDDKGNAIEETIYLGDLPVATIDKSGPHYISPDQIGAPHIIADSANSVLWTWAHAHRGDTGPVTAQNFTYNLRFADPVFDAETGVSDDMARDYNVALGRYVQSDPLGLIAGVNTYGYVSQNHVWAVDANGRNLLVVVGSYIALFAILTNEAYRFYYLILDVGLQMCNLLTGAVSSAYGPTLPTWALQQVGSYPGTPDVPPT